MKKLPSELRKEGLKDYKRLMKTLHEMNEKGIEDG
jgi:hypothetical protein